MTAWIAKAYRKHGPVFRVRAFSRVITVLAGPEANMFIQSKGRLHLRNVDFYSPVTRGLTAHRFVLGMDGAEHFRLRKTLRNGYSRRYVLDRIDDAIGLIARDIDALPAHTPISCQSLVQNIVCRQIGVLCTGVHADQHMKDLLIKYLDRLISITSMRRPKFLLHTPWMRRAQARVKALSEDIMRIHTPGNHDGNAPDLIDDILALHRSDPQFLPETDLMAACVGPFLAGLHTQASVASLMLYSLLKHPDLMKLVLHEVDDFFAGGGPTAEKLGAMDVTQRVGMETLRMYSVVPAQSRMVVNTFEFEGYAIPTGTTVLFANCVPHVLPEYFREPERFDIGRYSPDRAEHKQPGVYAPFGLGTHRCLGNGFSEASLALTLATMLHKVKITMHPPDYKLKMIYAPLPGPESKFKIMVAPRH